MEKSRLEKQMEFCLEIDKEKFIGRQTYLSDGIRKENDAEHAWHMAVMTLLLSEYANEKIDVLKTISMILFNRFSTVTSMFFSFYALDNERRRLNGAFDGSVNE